MSPSARPRARDLGLPFPGITGPLNAITDVAGIRVGQVTVTEGEGARTGVTAILPHGGNPFQDRVPAGLFAMNGFGKMAGVTQVQELGEIETPILLTNTLAVGRAVEALVDWTLAGVFVAGGVLGSLLGTQAGRRLSRRRGLLTRVFAGLILVVAAYMLARSLGMA